LKIETQIQEDHQAKLTVEIESEQMETMKHRAAKKIARKVKIPGFRPGKAPYPVIVRQVGEGPILEEAMELLVNDVYPKIIEEADIKPYGPGSLQEVSSMDPPILEFVIPLEAEVTLGDYRSLREPYEPKTVTDSDVDDVLSNLQERQAVIEPVDRSAQINDLVTTRLSANRTQIDDGENDILIEEQSIPFIILDKDKRDQDDDERIPDEWPYAGFSQNLIGLLADEGKTILHKYADDHQNEDYRGVEAEFQIMVESVKSRTLPNLDDEFAKSLGDYDNLEGLRNEITTTLEAQAEQTYNEQYDETIIDKTLEGTTIVYPPQMLEQEINSVISNLEERLKQQGLDMELYLKTRSLDMAGLREEVTPAAESRLKRSLLLLELAKEENIEIDPSQVQTETQTTIDYYKQTLSKKDARKLSNDNVYSNVMTNIMADMLMRQSMERLRVIFRGMDDEEDSVTEDISKQDGKETVTESVLEDDIETSIEIAGEIDSQTDGR